MTRPPLLAAPALFLALTALTAVAFARTGQEPVSPVALVHKECGACHLAFLPKFLPSDAWAGVIDHLDNHFGENAQLPPDATAIIRKYYVDRGSWGSWTPSAGHPLPRITDQVWWRKAMGNLDVSKSRIRSRANCGACHTHADWYMAVRE